MELITQFIIGVLSTIFTAGICWFYNIKYEIERDIFRAKGGQELL